MKRLYLPLILFLFLVLEGVALELLPDNLIKSDWFFVPHWVFVFLVYLAIFYERENTYHSVIYALVFGLLIDIVYTGILGIYMFSYGIAIYIIHGLRKILHGNIYVTILLGLIGIALSDISINIIFSLVGMSEILWEDYFSNRLLPTVISNLVFLLILYPIFAKRISRWGREQLAGRNTI
ncbi:rod shape-determining protein MreD [Virgibacillus indicus]|uniref:Rod shape-determining protein MreD n=1 Tax=Virgibacillus indicus TaxID=2024554 RepID=A0A265NDH3_9BACI|nr:rod shape-determining protein MreD [Virgibacillus indicus]OZU89825.1 rod shape-determining protein MreD [Virgibacillus indicus]